MNIDNQNKDLNWKSKLDELEGLPGEVFNKDDAWRKLRAREEKKKAFIKPAVYYVAAACIVIMLVLILFWPYNTEKILVRNRNVMSANKGINNIQNNDRRDSIVTVSAIPVKREVGHSTTKQKSVIAKKVDRASVENEIPSRDEKDNALANTTIDTIVTAVDTETAQINNVPVVLLKRKLPVVHINELGEHAEQPIVARKAETHSFRLNFGKQEVLTDPSAPLIKDGFTIFSNKNSPN